MPTDVSRPSIRGLLLGDLRLGYGSFSASLSSISQAGPLPGVPEAQRNTEMLLDSFGTQEANKKLRLTTTKKGQPKPDGGAFAWKYQGDVLYRGNDGPYQASYFDIHDYTNVANQWRHFHVITLSDHTLLTAAMKASQYVVVVSEDKATGVRTEVVVYDNGSAYSHSARPTLVELPSGRVLCLFWKEGAATTTNQVRMHYSDDKGATWTLGDKTCLAEGLNIGATITPKTLRAAYLNGQILLVAWCRDSSIADRSDVIYQWASSEIGSSFDLVDTWEGANDDSHGAYPSLFVANNEFVFHYLRRDTSTTGSIVPYQRRVADAYSLLSGATAELACQTTNPMKWGSVVAGPPDYFGDGDLSSWADDDGNYYMAGRDHDTGGGAFKECYVQRSKDGGLTWAMVGSGAAVGFGAAFWRGADTAVYPQDFSGTAQRGRSVLAHTFANSTGTYRQSLCYWYLGGYTTVTLPQLYSFPSPAERVAWESTWVGYDLPDVSGVYTITVAGVPTVTLTSQGVRFQGNAAAKAVYNITTAPTSTLTQGMMALFDMKAVDGTAYSKLTSGVAGPISYEVKTFVTPTAITVYDNVANVIIGSVATTEGATGVQLLVAVGNDAGAPANDGKARVWWRPTGNGSDRQYRALATSTALQAGAVATNGVEFGLSAGASASNDIYCRLVAHSSGIYTGQQLYNGQSNPGDLQGRNFSPTPGYVDGGTEIAAVDGPAFYGDSWNIDTRYEYGIENVFTDVSPSPDRPWRSVDTSTAQTIVLEYDSTLNQQSPSLEPLIGWAFLGCNWRVGYIEGDTGGGVWVTLATINTAQGQDSLKFTRQGDTVIPQGLPTVYNGARDWFTFNCLEGCYFEMELTGGGGYDQVRKIRNNSEGVFSNAPTKPARLQLEGVQALDSVGGAAPVGRIWAKDFVVVINGAGSYSRLRLRIPVQTTYEGYFQIGNIVPGFVVPFGWQYSRGRVLNTEPNVSLTTSRSGTRRARALGKSRRSVEVAWTDGVDVSAVTTANPSPDYLTGYIGSTTPVASPYDTPYTVAGVSELLQGSARPIVYLAGYARPSAADAVIVNNRNRFMYGRLVSPVRLESRVGSEWGSPGELFNVATITIEEEV